MARVMYEQGEAKRKHLESLIGRFTVRTEKDQLVKEMAQILWWLVDRWCKEHHNGKKEVLPRKPTEELDLPVL